MINTIRLSSKKFSTLYKQENYQTAIGVYNHAIRMFPKVPAYAYFYKTY